VPPEPASAAEVDPEDQLLQLLWSGRGGRVVTGGLRLRARGPTAPDEVAAVVARLGLGAFAIARPADVCRILLLSEGAQAEAVLGCDYVYPGGWTPTIDGDYQWEPYLRAVVRHLRSHSAEIRLTITGHIRVFSFGGRKLLEVSVIATEFA